MGNPVSIDITTVVLTSAVVSAAITSVITLCGQYLERNSRRREVLFTKSVELAKLKTDFLVQYSKDTKNSASIHDYVAYAEMYYWLLKKLHDDGCLPENWRSEIGKRFPLPPSDATRTSAD